MKIIEKKQEFHPVTIELESYLELEALYNIMHCDAACTINQYVFNSGLDHMIPFKKELGKKLYGKIRDRVEFLHRHP